MNSVAHLLEYKRYKEVTENLSSLTQLDRDTFVREPAEDTSDFSKASQPLDVGLPELLHSLRELLTRTARRDLDRTGAGATPSKGQDPRDPRTPE